MVTRTAPAYKVAEYVKELTFAQLRLIYDACSFVVWAAREESGVVDEAGDRALMMRSQQGKLNLKIAVTAIQQYIQKVDKFASSSRPSIYKFLQLAEDLGCWVRIKGTFGPHHDRRTPSPPLQCVNLMAVMTLFKAAEMCLKDRERLLTEDWRDRNLYGEITYTDNVIVRYTGEDNLPNHRGMTVINFFENVTGCKWNAKLAQSDQTEAAKKYREFLYGIEPGEAEKLPSPHAFGLFAVIRRGWEAIASRLPSILNPPEEDTPPEPPGLISPEQWRRLVRVRCAQPV